MTVEKNQKKRGGVRKKPSLNQKRARRSDFEFPCLEPSVTMLKRREAVVDVASYASQLSHEEKAWMNQFMKEYNEATTKDAVFHVTAEERKICNDINNARNRCWYTEEEAANRLNLVENEYELERIIHAGVEDDEQNYSEREDED